MRTRRYIIYSEFRKYPENLATQGSICQRRFICIIAMYAALRILRVFLRNDPMSIESPSLGERIKTLRLERGLSMRALAQGAGLKSVAFVADLERGFRHPSAEVLAALARTLNQPLESLRRYDLRPPVHELRALTIKDPNWALALRKLVDLTQSRGLTPDDLIRLLDKPLARVAGSARSSTSRAPAVADTPPLFEN